MIFVHLESTESFKYFLEQAGCEDITFNVSPVNYRIKGIQFLLYKFLSSKKIFKILPHLPRRWLSMFLVDKNTSKKISNENNVCFILHGYTDLTPHHCYFLRKKYPSAKLIMVFEDKVQHYKDNYRSFKFENVKVLFDCALTYNSIDAGNYGMGIYPPIIPNYSSIRENKDFCQNDVFFIGRDKGRLNNIIDIFDLLTKQGLKCDFHIVGVKKKNRINRNGVVYHNKPIPYDVVLQKNLKTKAILNLVQDGATGVTLRDFEAISMNKVLITNCKDIVNYSFFAEEKVVFLDKIDCFSLEMLNAKSNSCWNNRGVFSLSNYYRAIKMNLDYKNQSGSN